MNKATYVASKHIQKEYDISTAALRKWSNEGKVETIRAPGGKRLYKAQDIQKLFGKGTDGLARKGVCYARVSSEHQREDLERQIQDLQKAYPGHEILSDIGSGLNWKRKAFHAILDRAFQGDLSEIVVTHKDRLCRFGYELLETIFQKLDVKLVVHGQDAPREDSTTELSEDLLSIVTVFVARNNGKRGAENRKRRKRETIEEEKNKRSKGEREDSSGESDQDSDLSKQGGEGASDEVDGNSSVDLQ